MLIATSIHLHRAMREVVRLACCILLLGGVDGQVSTPPSSKRINETSQANVADAIAKVKSGNFVDADVDMIRRGGAVEAITILRQHFVTSAS